ncbi:hypothetical protein BZG36_02793 [Bifiguratus adelaidae]|uniref:Mediator of RNA polymerase II transcription subunit 7 n=1 Tax=Bifiguratus adelaidae TaxID=1938954 RepID=A0A261Y1E2_9FUNG|nr:hypothetical protein BZG36_02793 [Bifiguratus adelaidae]
MAKHGSSWPEPPFYYKRYTAHNVSLLEQWKGGKSAPPKIKAAELEHVQEGDGEKVVVKEVDLPVHILEPPKPTFEDGSYSLFNQTWQIEDKLPSLSEMDVEQLYPDGPIDRIKELKKLNHSLVINYLQLLDLLVKNPQQFDTKVQHLRTIFINMHHLINEYRPHQAREILILLMQQQVERKRKATEQLEAKCRDMTDQLAALKTTLQTQLSDIPMFTEQTSATTPMILDGPDGKAEQKLVDLVDEID